MRDRIVWVGLVLLGLAACGERESGRVVRRTAAEEGTDRAGVGKAPATLPPRAIATH